MQPSRHAAHKPTSQRLRKEDLQFKAILGSTEGGLGADKENLATTLVLPMFISIRVTSAF